MSEEENLGHKTLLGYWYNTVLFTRRASWYSLPSSRIGIIWYGYSMVWYGMVWYGMVWYGMVWYGMVWYGMVWHGMVRYGMGIVWYGMI